MDSGVSLESNSIESRQERPSIRQDDSGCGSLGGQESSASDQTTYPLQAEGSKMGTAGDKVDRGQLNSSPLNMNQQSGGPLKEAVYGGNYRSQIPRNVDICNNKVELSEILQNPSLAERIHSYRTGLQSCICSGAGQCTWCHKNGSCAALTTQQSKATCPENGLLSGKCNSMNAYKVSVFPKDAQTDSISVNDIVPLTHLQETFPMLSSFSLLPSMDEGQDINMNNLSLSLCDIQLVID